MPRTVAISGVTGFIGRHLMRVFLERGWNVVGLCRRPADQTPIAGASFVRFDLHEPPQVSFDGVDTLIHAALEPYRGTGSPESVNVAGSRALFERAIARGVKRILFLSSTASRQDTQSQYGSEKFAIEQLLDPQRDIVIRPGLVVGDGGLFGSMARSIQKMRMAPVFLGGRQPVYTVGISDLCGAIVHLTDRGRAGTYVLAARDPVAMRSLYRQIAAKVGVDVRLLALPFGPTLFALGIAERLGIALPVTTGSMLGVAGMKHIDVPTYDGIDLAPFSSSLDAIAFTTS